MTRLKQFYVMGAFMLVLAGCASLGLQPAQSFGDKVAYANGTATGVLQATTASVTAGSVSKKDGQAVLTMVENAKSLIDSADAAYASNPASATANLTLALDVLTKVQTYLSTHQGAKP